MILDKKKVEDMLGFGHLGASNNHLKVRKYKEVVDVLFQSEIPHLLNGNIAFVLQKEKSHEKISILGHRIIDLYSK